MKKAGIAELKNNLSRYLDFVRAGETVLVFDRKVPVARIVPIGGGLAGKLSDEQRLAYLERVGAIRRGKGGMGQWLKRHRPVKVCGSVLKDLLEERESGW